MATLRREDLASMTYLVAAVILAMLIYGIWIFNRLVRERNLVREGWSGIDVQLRRRTDLVPALVETVKGYAAHERKLFEDITAIRSASLAASNVKTQENAERELKGALSKLIALKEAYPNLKADQNFLKLQEQLAEIEDHLQMARRYYNGSVRNLNITIQSFPNVLIARPLGFTEAEFFEADDSASATPRVTFEREPS
jgi:LemA protein